MSAMATVAGVRASVIQRATVPTLMIPSPIVTSQVVAMEFKKPAKLFVGLGNPGGNGTRHNAGRMAVEQVAAMACVNFSRIESYRAYLATVSIKDRDVHLMLPDEGMNRSGDSVYAFVKDVGIESQNVTVAVDDTAFPVGDFRLQPQGGHGGHNGLKSIQEVIGEYFPRIRIGIGKPTPKLTCTLGQYVLGHFTAEEKKTLPFHGVAQALIALMHEDFLRVATTFNTKKERI